MEQRGACALCPAGSHQPLYGHWAVASCTLCPRGHFALRPGTAACEPCALGHYTATVGSVSCAACEADARLNLTTTAHSGATSSRSCVCAAGAWLPEWPRRGGRRCVACPHGATCGGLFATPMALPGFWSAEDELQRAMAGAEVGGGGPARFWRCAGGALACPGGGRRGGATVGTTLALGGSGGRVNATASCALDRYGPRCAACAPGFFRLGVLCQPCADPPWWPPLLTLLLIGWPHAVAWLHVRTKAVMVVVQAGQALALLGTLSLPWPSGAAGFRVAETLGAARLLLQDPGLSSLGCDGVSPVGSGAWVLMQLLPLIELSLLMLMNALVYCLLTYLVAQPADEVAVHLRGRLRWTVGYWIRVLVLQWPGLIYRAMLRVRCEADPLASGFGASASYSVASTSLGGVNGTGGLSSGSSSSNSSGGVDGGNTASGAANLTSGSTALPSEVTAATAAAAAAVAHTPPPRVCVHGGDALDAPLLPLAAVLLLALVAAPLMATWRVHTLHQARSQTRRHERELFGRLYAAYRPGCYAWEAVGTGGRFLLLVCASTLLPEHRSVQACLCLATLVLGCWLRARHRPHVVRLYDRLGGACDAVLVAVLLLAMVGERVSHAPLSWTASGAEAVEALATCVTQWELLDAEDTSSGALCLKVAAPFLTSLLLLACGGACLVAMLVDLRHHARLTALLQLPPGQYDETDPHALSSAAAASALALPPSKRRLLSAHLRALRATPPSADAESLAHALCTAFPALPDLALRASPEELAALRAVLTRLGQTGGATDGPACRGLRLPTRVALCAHLLDASPSDALAPASARLSLTRLLREVTAHPSLPPEGALLPELEGAEEELRVPGDSLLLDGSHELGLYAQVATGPLPADPDAAGAEELATLWLPVRTASDFDLTDATVDIRFDTQSLSAALQEAGAPPDGKGADGKGADGKGADGKGADDEPPPVGGGGSERLVAVLAPDGVSAPPLVVYEVSVATSAREGAGTHARVSAILYGEGGVSGEVGLHGGLGESPFGQPGSLATFRVALPDLGPLTHLRLSHDGAFAACSWHVFGVEVRALDTGEAYAFDIQQWLGPTLGQLGASVMLPPTRTWQEPPSEGEGGAAQAFAAQAHPVAPLPLVMLAHKESEDVTADAVPDDVGPPAGQPTTAAAPTHRALESGGLGGGGLGGGLGDGLGGGVSAGSAITARFLAATAADMPALPSQRGATCNPPPASLTARGAAQLHSYDPAALSSRMGMPPSTALPPPPSHLFPPPSYPHTAAAYGFAASGMPPLPYLMPAAGGLGDGQWAVAPPPAAAAAWQPPVPLSSNALPPLPEQHADGNYLPYREAGAAVWPEEEMCAAFAPEEGATFMPLSQLRAQPQAAAAAALRPGESAQQAVPPLRLGAVQPPLNARGQQSAAAPPQLPSMPPLPLLPASAMSQTMGQALADWPGLDSASASETEASPELAQHVVARAPSPARLAPAVLAEGNSRRGASARGHQGHKAPVARV